MLLTENEYNLENTTDFADRLNNYTLEDDEIITSYDVSSLFIDEPLDISFDYIIEEIYTKNKLSKLCSKTSVQMPPCNIPVHRSTSRLYF